MSATERDVAETPRWSAPRSLTLLLGGARSGKSDHAIRLARGAKRVLFVATAEALDDDMTARIGRHRAERPADWATLEEPRALPSALAAVEEEYDLVIVDCVTLWVSNLLLAGALAGESAEAEAARQAGLLLASYEAGRASWILISNEVGLGIVPPTGLGRTYRDALGRVNCVLSAAADRVELLVAGLPVTVKANVR